MPYSLVSAATLGFDLVRLPGGPDAAAVLLAGLGAEPEHLRRWAAQHPVATGTAGQRSRWVDRGTRIREIAAEGVPGLRGIPGQTDPQARTEALVALLEQGTIGDGAAVERLLRDDVLGPESTAVAAVGPEVGGLAADVLADAVITAWASAAVPDRDHRACTAAVQRGGSVPLPDLGPAADGLLEVVARLQGSSALDVGRWRVAVDEVRAGRREWAAAMHGAAWAAHVSGRTRALAAAQLLGVRAFRDGGFTPADGARGVWNAIAGCIQGVAMFDLLDGSSLDQLLLPWLVVHGSHPSGVDPSGS